jgi:outer membrane protein assembly factor BamB
MNYSRGEPSFGYIDAATGKKLWSKGTGQKPMSAPVIAEGAIYFIADDGKVHAVK